ncbi:MAG: Cytochrome [Planctomycetota bacterium]|nr:Cytochrome [Planctomycetota bacterium]
MNYRKGSVLALSSLLLGLGAAGLSLAVAGDEDSKLHKAMEVVQAKNGFIMKNTKTAAVFKKNQKDIVEATKTLTKIGKEFREDDVETKDKKKDKKAWTDLMDAFVSETEKFAVAAGKDDAKQPDVKKAYANVSGTCTKCHDLFRPEE